MSAIEYITQQDLLSAILKITALQQRLALKDLEILRLREALRKAVMPKKVKAGSFDVVPSEELLSEDEVDKLLSTTPTQADLDSYVKEMLGEPKGYMWPDVESISLYKDEFFTIPLYALRKAE